MDAIERDFRLHALFARREQGVCSMRRMRHSRTLLAEILRNRRGAAAVEFAILAPLFIFLMLGMVGYGIYFGAAHSIQQLAADAARTAIAGLDEAERRSLAQLFVTRNAAGYAFIEPDRLTVDVHDSVADGSQFIVGVSYDASNLPIWNLFSGLAMPTTTITRSSTIRIGGL